MSSTCRDFEHLCQAALDRREIDGPGLGPDLDAHAASCPSCLPIYHRYLHLRHAISALPTPIPAQYCVDRTLRAFAERPAATIRFSKPVRVALALAATVLLAGLIAVRSRPAPETIGPEIVKSSETQRPLGVALSEATSETLGLAREASAPAARVGREMIRSASIPSMDWGLAFSTDPASEALQSVGDEVEAGVRPLSGSARSAFGFLIPSASRSRTPAASPAPKGAEGT